ncbi:NUDIX hydrolase [Streptomyces typhae]|uniref:NUDIX hydrolase n=1 Tax=Streptomyces typhae TaxID=2681492 RepID=UPI0031B5CD8A
MPVTADHIRETLDAYLAAHPDEKGLLARLEELLDTGADLASRKEFRGHVTAGRSSPTPRAGSSTSSTSPWTAGSCPADTGHRPVHIDAHAIPANPANDEPAHRHFDFRFLFRTSADVVEPQTEEVTAAAWRDADAIEDTALRRRVREALR